MKDPSEREIPIQFADEDDVCEHGKWKVECKECFSNRNADYLIEIRKENDEE